MDVNLVSCSGYFGHFWSDTSSLRRVTFPAYLDLCASIFSWLDQWNLCLPQLVSVCQKNTLGASPPLEDCLGGVSSKGCISKAWGNCDAFTFDESLWLYDCWKELASWNGAFKMGWFTSPLLSLQRYTVWQLGRKHCKYSPVQLILSSSPCPYVCTWCVPGRTLK